MRAFLLLPIAAILATLPFVESRPSPAADSSSMALPQFDSSGALLRPTNFDHWLFVGSNIGMTYSDDHRRAPANFTTFTLSPKPSTPIAPPVNSPKKPHSSSSSISPPRRPASIKAAILKAK